MLNFNWSRIKNTKNQHQEWIGEWHQHRPASPFSLPFNSQVVGYPQPNLSASLCSAPQDTQEFVSTCASESGQTGPQWGLWSHLGKGSHLGQGYKTGGIRRREREFVEIQPVWWGNVANHESRGAMSLRQERWRKSPNQSSSPGWDNGPLGLQCRQRCQQGGWKAKVERDHHTSPVVQDTVGETSFCRSTKLRAGVFWEKWTKQTNF